jgi:hypothetical protein
MVRVEEELRHQREWDDDGTVTRGFIHNAIMQAEGYEGVPLFERPAPPFVRPDAAPGGFADMEEGYEP